MDKKGEYYSRKYAGTTRIEIFLTIEFKNITIRIVKHKQFMFFYTTEFL